MIPKLLVSNNQKGIQKYVEAQIEKFAISPFDTISLGENGNPIKIEQIRDLKQKLGLKPSMGSKKATIIYAAQNLTAEAQNALLKTLEEPPEDTVILLCTPNENLLLPTIVSRCEIVRLNSKQKNVIPDPQLSAGLTPAGILTTLTEIQRMDIGEKFKLVEDLTKKLDKDEALDEVRRRVDEWLAAVVTTLHHKILKDAETEQNVKNLKTFLACQKQLRQNLNIRLVLENHLLELYNK